MPWFRDRAGVLRPWARTAKEWVATFKRILPSLEPKPSNIWCFKQNRPSLIANDMHVMGVPKEATYRVLLSRGVFKWFRVREQVIAFKHQIKVELQGLYEEQTAPGTTHQKLERRGRIKALEDVREHLRRLCHGPRWAAIDHDENSKRWLRKYEEEIDNNE